MSIYRILTVGLLQAGLAVALRYADNQVKVVKDSDAASAHFKSLDEIELYSPAFVTPGSVPAQFENGTSGPTNGATMGKFIPSEYSLLLLTSADYFLRTLAERNDWMTYHDPDFKSEEGRSIPYVFLSTSTKPESANSTAPKRFACGCKVVSTETSRLVTKLFLRYWESSMPTLPGRRHCSRSFTSWCYRDTILMEWRTSSGISPQI